MQSASWKSSLARALHRNRSFVSCRYVQLATVRPDGHPANRTLVFRGFLATTDQLQFVTDHRSQKVEQMQLFPWGELCWYFPKTREQFRISGKLRLISDQDEDQPEFQSRQTLWHHLSDAAQEQFSWPPSGQPRTTDQDFKSVPYDRLLPNPNFCLLLLNPVLVDHLELRGDPQNRWQYQQSALGEWIVQAINP